MACNLCNGTGEVRENQGHTLSLIPCPRCTSRLKDCTNGHIRITYRAELCPLCASQQLVKTYQAELRRWRGLSQTIVQKKASEISDVIKSSNENENPETPPSPGTGE